ncbi:Periplasmic thiol:disulfide oxidoreductase DsbB, required for DsbA reoxidation, partial [hydrothermal vent metagenome]
MRVNKLDKIGTSAWFWLALVILGLSLEGLALVYQYVLEYWPCVLCIHVRIWVVGLVVAAVAGLVLRQKRSGRIIAHALVLVVSLGLLERSWKLFAIERGFAVDGECNFDAGLPAWFALDQWFPAIFKVWEACGYTPELLFGVTMAEALLGLSSVLV